jgi:hypothetical protein
LLASKTPLVAIIEEKQEFLKAIFPGCLTTVENGYRTPYITSLFSVKAPSIESLVSIKKEGELSSSDKLPFWVANGARTQDALLDFRFF